MKRKGKKKKQCSLYKSGTNNNKHLLFAMKCGVALSYVGQCWEKYHTKSG